MRHRCRYLASLVECHVESVGASSEFLGVVARVDAATVMLVFHPVPSIATFRSLWNASTVRGRLAATHRAHAGRESRHIAARTAENNVRLSLILSRAGEQILSPPSTQTQRRGFTFPVRESV